MVQKISPFKLALTRYKKNVVKRAGNKSIQYNDTNYNKWIEKNELANTARKQIQGKVDNFEIQPLISIIMPVYNVNPIWLEKAISSVKKQLYPYWELCVVNDASTDTRINDLLSKHASDDPRIKLKILSRNSGIATASNEAVAISSGQYIGLLDHDDEISIDALYENVKLLNRYPDAQLIYSDKDKIDINGNRLNPFFKPDYSPDLLLSQNYMCHFNVIAKSVFEKIGGFRKGFDGSQDHDLLLRITEQTDQIYHIPKILYHWRMIPQSTASGFSAKPKAWKAGVAAVQDALKRRGIQGEVDYGQFNGTYRVKRRVLKKALVSIIVLVKCDIKILKRCIESALKNTNYNNYEIIGIFDQFPTIDSTLNNNFVKSNKKVDFVKIYTKRITSSDLNRAVKGARGQQILFLNGSLEIAVNGWLEALLEHSERPEVGTAGGKYYLPDGRLLHAGFLIKNDDGVGCSHRFFHKDDVGYYAQTHIIRNVTGVSGAFMMVQKNLFEQLGGFDAKKLKFSYYDIDFCLRLREKGFLNVFTPYCEAIFHSKEKIESEFPNEHIKHKWREKRFFKKKWRKILSKGDPYYNPNFDPDKTDFSFKL